MYRSATALLLTALSLNPFANAAIVQRCVGAQGAITYTDSNCPEPQAWSRQRAYNPASGRKPMATKPKRRALPVTIVEDSGKARAQKIPPATKGAKSSKGSKKRKSPRYLSPLQVQVQELRKLKRQKAKSPQ